MCIWLWRKPANNIHCMSYLDQTGISAIMDARIIWWMAMGSCQDAHLFHKMSIWIWSNGHLTWFRWSCPGWDPNCTGELGTILVGTDGHLENLGQWGTQWQTLISNLLSISPFACMALSLPPSNSLFVNLVLSICFSIYLSLAMYRHFIPSFNV